MKQNDASFPANQFLIEGYSTLYRLDRTIHGGRLLPYVREDIPSKLLISSFSIEGLFIDIHLKKRKWILFGGYNPNKSLIYEFLSELSNNLDSLPISYGNLVVIGDFNSEVDEKSMIDFCETYNMQTLIKDFTCYKSPANPSCIALILTSNVDSFQNSKAYDTGLSDFHYITVAAMQMKYQKN